MGSEQRISSWRDILEVDCPACYARAGDFCYRVARGGRKGDAGKSHEERLWLRQGHDPSEFEALREGRRKGKKSQAGEQAKFDDLRNSL